MKSLIKNSYLSFSLLLLLGMFVTSCSKDEPSVSTPVDSTASFIGSFVSSAHTTSGNASVNKEKTKLNFTDFKTDSGPNLDIYLASSVNNVNADFISLGDLKGRNGSYTYDLPASIDFAKYKFVVVWCKDFNVNFGYATLAL